MTDIKVPRFEYDFDGTPKFVVVKCEGRLVMFERLSVG